MPSPSRTDRTLELFYEDLVPMAPGPSSEPTIQLTAEDVVVLEGVSAAAEVVVFSGPRPSRGRRVLALVSSRCVVAARRAGRLAARGWTRSRRGASLARAAARPALRALVRASGVVLRTARALLVAGRSGLRRGWHRIWDLTFPLRDWASLKLGRTGRRSRTGRPVVVRAAGPSDRAIIADLELALSAHSKGAPGSKLQIVEVGGRVAVMVPGREPKVEVRHVSAAKTDSTLLGRPVMVSTR